MLNEPHLHQEMVPAEVYMQRAAASFALKINNPSELKKFHCYAWLTKSQSWLFNMFIKIGNNPRVDNTVINNLY